MRHGCGCPGSTRRQCAGDCRGHRWVRGGARQGCKQQRRISVLSSLSCGTAVLRYGCRRQREEHHHWIRGERACRDGAQPRRCFDRLAVTPGPGQVTAATEARMRGCEVALHPALLRPCCHATCSRIWNGSSRSSYICNPSYIRTSRHAQNIRTVTAQRSCKHLNSRCPAVVYGLVKHPSPGRKVNRRHRRLFTSWDRHAVLVCTRLWSAVIDRTWPAI
jgi:hypothetical protein